MTFMHKVAKRLALLKHLVRHVVTAVATATRVRFPAASSAPPSLGRTPESLRVRLRGPSRGTARLGFALGLGLAVASCEKPVPLTGPNTAAVASVVINPPATTVAVGTTVQLTGTPQDSSGRALPGLPVTWSSSNLGSATINAGGVVTGVAVGVTTITATTGTKHGYAAVTVTPPAVASVTVSPGAATVPFGSTVQLTATPKDASGNPLASRVVTWASNNPLVATVNANGLVTGVAAGTATITATSEGKSGSAAITVQ